ncbi:hypothetical protein FFWV33_04415 [Flavobacterium faecale]|uniref:Secretion system C-terminal sorting domain-containing protein n=1 Tax=Flavobacterium faecale TaxID=1355330 RepID=A0A2S1LAR0_9FLAO|nr:T9SS type A sorting domain-containing protein [Flavobacterium faecale]AWG20839.1 hypothetical protein FFWV33_04415 [Flavobacterium faecale]
MKKTLLSSLIILLCSISSYSQSVRITGLVVGNCPTGSTAPQVIELYVDGTVDVTNLKIQYQFASADFWVINNNIGVGEYTDTFLYLVNDITAFDNNFPGIRTASNTTFGSLISSVEGGEKIRLVDSSKSDQVIDIYGIDGQNGELKTWNFKNSYVKRNNNVSPNSTFIESEWTIKPKNTLLFKGVCWTEPALNTIIGLQSYTLSTNEYNLTQAGIKVFPNPSNDFIEIIGLNEIENYEIYNTLGQVVKSGIVLENNKIEIHNLTSGIYFLKFKNGNTIKFIKA